MKEEKTLQIQNQFFNFLGNENVPILIFRKQFIFFLSRFPPSSFPPLISLLLCDSATEYMNVEWQNIYECIEHIDIEIYEF